MAYDEKTFEVKKTFGLGVLMKLTKKSNAGLEVNTIGDRFISNVSENEMTSAVTNTLRLHNIRLKV